MLSYLVGELQREQHARDGEMNNDHNQPRVHWVTSYVGIGSSYGYHVHDSKAREAFVAAGGELDDDSPVAFHVTPPHQFKPVQGKLNVAYCAWESEQLPALFGAKLRDVDLLLVPAQFLKAPFEAMLPGVPVEVVPLGVDSETFSYVNRMESCRRPNFRPRPRGTPFRFLYVGAASDRKFNPQLLETIGKAFGTSGRIQEAATVGDRELTAFDRYAAAGCEIYMKVTQQGSQKYIADQHMIWDERRLPTPELVKLYHKAHAFIFPTLGEGFGLSLAESLATGLPAIYTPATACLDLLPLELDAGYPLKFERHPQHWRWPSVDGEGTEMAVEVEAPVVTPQSLVERMLDVMEDYPLAVNRATKAARYVSTQFTWRKCGQRLVSIIANLPQKVGAL
jgi:glycosyltransferase involved in cell wall biosynthesis